jgi:hypothetical protein
MIIERANVYLFLAERLSLLIRIIINNRISIIKINLCIAVFISVISAFWPFGIKLEGVPMFGIRAVERIAQYYCNLSAIFQRYVTYQ